MKKPNIFGLIEYSRDDLFVDVTDALREADRFYIMTEADAVLKGQEELIKKKDKAFEYSKAVILVDIEIIKKQKIKHCLAMSSWCESEVHHIRRKPLCDMSEHEYWQYEDEFWQRWNKRWLSYAERIKKG